MLTPATDGSSLRTRLPLHILTVLRTRCSRLLHAFTTSSPLTRPRCTAAALRRAKLTLRYVLCKSKRTEGLLAVRKERERGGRGGVSK